MRGDFYFLALMVYRSIFRNSKRCQFLVLINDHDPESKSYLFKIANFSRVPWTGRLGGMFCRRRSYLKQLSTENLSHLSSVERLFIVSPENNYRNMQEQPICSEAIENSQAQYSTMPGAFRHRSRTLTSVPHQPEESRTSHRKPHQDSRP